MFIGICNPDALSIRIFNPIIALQMLIFNAVGLQIRPNVKIRPNATIIALQMLILNAVGLMFIGICNPDALNIRIFNPVIALQMLILNAVGLQIRPNVRK